MELLDVYNDQGVPTGRTVIRGDKTAKFNDNEHIAIAVVFIQNNKGEFLIQKTSKEKGGEYSSTGGHVDSGETPLQSIEREIKEELGLNIDKNEIVELGYMLFDMPIRFLYYVKKDINLSDIKPQEEEVESVKFMSCEEINNLINSKVMLKSHAVMFEELLKRLNK